MKNTGIEAAKILLPKVDNFTAWACIACDQFTGEQEYWDKLKEEVKDNPSSLNLYLPEIYLDGDEDLKIAQINDNIEKYLASGVFEELKSGFILTVRSTPFVKKRIGIIGAVDLEEYDFKAGAKPLIRATEGTIEERIPPRLKIRKDASIEMPHVMILFDDEKKEIAEYYYKKRATLKKLYDFDLNMGGGHIEGYFIEDSNEVKEKFSHLLDKERLEKKYGSFDKFAFAVGDGNHSLATAKTHWENLKKTLTEEQKKTHPARYALAEFNNIYDEGIYFEPIFRFVFGINVKNFIDGLAKIDGGKMTVTDGKTYREFDGKNSLPSGIRAVDNYIKEYIEKNGGKVDYIHGEENLKNLVIKDGNAVGILFPKLDKQDLFKYVSKNGSFPRKTFSMGEGIEKRYYLEGRKIK